MKNVFKSILLFVTISLISSCVKEDYGIILPTDCVSPGLTANKTVANIYSVAINPLTPALPAPQIPNTPTYLANDIIEGYMISSDEGGNFYQSMYFQPLDGSKGFNVSAEVKNIYNKIEPGRKVFIKLKGLGFANPTSFGVGLILGAPPTDKYAVDRIQSYNVEQVIFPTCDVVNEDDIVHKVSLANVTNDIYLNTLVEIDNVQFTDLTAGGTYDADITNTFDDNTYITDNVNELALRTSRYATFAGYKTPKGNGKIRGVLTKYNSGYQIVIRTTRDVSMNNPRIISPSNPLGGTNLSFLGALNETFTSYAVDNTVFPEYINDKTIGNKYWKLKQYPAGTGNKYIEMSSFAGSGNPGTIAKSYFMVPVDFGLANSFTFKKEARYYYGDVLKVYYVKQQDFVRGFLNSGVFTDITSNFNITYPSTTNTSQNAFDSAGTYNIPSDLTGNGYFVFEYSGGGTVTTTMQIDDIVIQ